MLVALPATAMTQRDVWFGTVQDSGWNAHSSRCALAAWALDGRGTSRQLRRFSGVASRGGVHRGPSREGRTGQKRDEDT